MLDHPPYVYYGQHKALVAAAKVLGQSDQVRPDRNGRDANGVEWRQDADTARCVGRVGCGNLGQEERERDDKPWLRHCGSELAADVFRNGVAGNRTHAGLDVMCGASRIPRLRNRRLEVVTVAKVVAAP